MNSPRNGLGVGSFVFGLVCLAHLWRVIAHIQVQIGTYTVPIWLSIFGAILAGILSIWFWRLSRS